MCIYNIYIYICTHTHTHLQPKVMAAPKTTYPVLVPVRLGRTMAVDEGDHVSSSLYQVSEKVPSDDASSTKTIFWRVLSNYVNFSISCFITRRYKDMVFLINGRDCFGLLLEEGITQASRPVRFDL